MNRTWIDSKHRTVRCCACQVIWLLVIVALQIAFSINANAQPGTFNATGSMSIQRSAPAGALLLNGTVLITGGIDATRTVRGTAEFYRPSTGQFISTGDLITARFAHTATLLQNSKVLIAGGINNDNVTTSTAEIYDPSSGEFSATGSMTIPRANHTATLLADGKVLITGGKENTNTTRGTAELYDPSTGRFTATGSMHLARETHTATLLASGKVLVAGGDGGVSGGASSTNTGEIYDPATGIFSFASNQMAHEHFQHAAVLLPNGKVLIAGGRDVTTNPASWAELYDPSSNSFSSTGNMNEPRTGLTLTRLSNGQVLVVDSSSFSSNGPTSTFTAELYTPSSGTFALTGNTVNEERVNHVAALLSNGQVLIAGGNTDTAELYTPPSMPTAKIMAPITRATVAGTENIFTTVASSVVWIDVYIDGHFLASSPPYNFSWHTTTVPNGTHTISIAAFNGSGKVGSDSVTVIVANGSAGPVTITAPANGATVSGTVTIDTTISSSVDWENIYIDGKYFDSSPPENFSWNSTSVANGSHTISAKGFNSSDQVVGQSSVTVTVHN